jgi:hypothetical protein
VESDDEDRSLLICDVSFLAIGRIVLPQFSGPNSSPRMPLSMKMNIPLSFKTSGTAHQTTRRHIAEDSRVQDRRCFMTPDFAYI